MGAGALQRGRGSVLGHFRAGCGSGPRPRKGAKLPAGSQRLFSPESPHRDRVCPSRTRCEYIPVSSDLAIPGQIRSWMGTPDPGAPWKIPSSPPWRVRRCYGPWRFRYQVSGAMVVPGGSCLAREGQTNSGHGWLERSRKAPPLHRVSDTEHRTSEQQPLWHPAGWLKPPFRGRGPLPQPALKWPNTDPRPRWRVPAPTHRHPPMEGPDA